MLAGAVRSYVNRFAATPGKRISIFTNNDDGWRTARDLSAQGVSVAAVIDSRDIAPLTDIPHAKIVMGAGVMDTSGRKALKEITLTTGQRITTDCLAVSGGWNPNVHLTCHQRGRPSWAEDINAFVPGKHLPPGMQVVGAAQGDLTLSQAIAAARIKRPKRWSKIWASQPREKPHRKASDEASMGAAFWHVGASKARAWIDLQNDVTVKDIRQSYQEGFRSVEHLKRYTTLGMATDQGKTSNIPALAIMAECTGKTIPETGTTIFRPPYTPVPMGALAGRARGKDFRPYRLTPSHRWAAENGATFVETGNWLRAQWYARPGEKGWRDSVDREVEMTRSVRGHLRCHNFRKNRYPRQRRCPVFKPGLHQCLSETARGQSALRADAARRRHRL